MPSVRRINSRLSEFFIHLRGWYSLELICDGLLPQRLMREHKKAREFQSQSKSANGALGHSVRLKRPCTTIIYYSTAFISHVAFDITSRQPLQNQGVVFLADRRHGGQNLLQVLLGGFLSTGLFPSSLLVCVDSFFLHTLIHQIISPQRFKIAQNRAVLIQRNCYILLD